jgi:hypothetical protein
MTTLYILFVGIAIGRKEKDENFGKFSQNTCL